MHVYGLSEEQAARVVVKNLGNAARNPAAFHGQHVTLDGVLSAPVVADPLRALDIAPDADGAVALILASEEKARALTPTTGSRRGTPAWVLGLGTCYDAHYLGDRDLADCTALERATQQAYRMAGLVDPRREIDLVELGDEFSYQELLWLEGLGLCERGGGGRLTESGVTAINGELPVNPSGGLLGGVPANVAGLNRVAEAALQVMGRAGSHQVPGVEIAVAQGHSGFCGQHHCVIVLGKEPL